jgi:Domain of unknown function (DUF6532)
LLTHPNHYIQTVAQITSRGSHFRGRIKTKIRPHVKTMYGFSSSGKPSAIEKNVKLARELKKEFAFYYAVRLSIYTHISPNDSKLETHCNWKQGVLPPSDYPASCQRYVVLQQEG